MQPAIRARGVAKRYRLDSSNARYKALRDTLNDFWKIPFRAWRKGSVQPRKQTLWALQDVSFEVWPGEIVGVVGRNGSGKSTLLKILSRVTPPTAGEVEIDGRVGSLLEVGTGFHPELSGRENIFLNGAILGMKRVEIQGVFDQIVDFAGVAQHLDTPVKRYSSGMHMRLAFAVAAHLDTEILLMDEVLAVGDLAFQQKCLGRIGEVARSGRTILLVSHNMEAVLNTCRRCMLLENGRLLASGATAEVVAEHKARTGAAPSRHLHTGVLYEDMSASGRVIIRKVEALDEDGRPMGSIATWDFVRLRFWVESDADRAGVALEIHVNTLAGQPVLRLSTMPYSDVPVQLRQGLTCVDCVIPNLLLSGGRFVLTAGVSVPLQYWVAPLMDLTILEVQPATVYSSSLGTPLASEGLLAIPHEWQVGG